MIMATNRETSINQGFHRSKQKLIIDFLHKMKAKIVKTIGAHSKSTVLVFRSFKRNIHLVTHYL